MNTKSFFNSILILLLLPACATAPKYVDSKGVNTVVSTGKVNIQDFAAAADQFVQTILAKSANGELPSGDSSKPAILAISRISNNTTSYLDTDQLIKKIRVELNRSGQFVTTTTLGIGGVAEDPLAKELSNFRELTGKSNNSRLPDYTLSGKIFETRAKQDRLRQVTFTFQLSLTSNEGLAIWEDEIEITKQSKTSAVSW